MNYELSTLRDISDDKNNQKKAKRQESKNMTTGRPHLYSGRTRRRHRGCPFCVGTKPNRIDGNIAHWLCGAWKPIDSTPDPTPEQIRAQFPAGGSWAMERHEIACHRCGKVFQGKTTKYCHECYRILRDMGHMGKKDWLSKITPEDEKEIVELRKKGMLLREIAAKYEVTQATICTHLKKHLTAR